MNEEDSLLALHLVPNLGPVRTRSLISSFGSANKALNASHQQLNQIQGIGPELVRGIQHAAQSGEWETELRRIINAGAWILTDKDARYPNLLRQLPNAPILLQVIGTLTEADQHAIAIVGSRQSTFYGNECAKRFSYQLAYAGFTIVSGLARGIDTAAHLGAMAAKGRTIAVIGSGLGELYPPENRNLAERITKQGAIVSEFPMGFPPTPQTFPYRNRIVAGWSTGLLVVEAGLKSGALITANIASEQGRQVYAIPGPIDRTSSAGTNHLIQQGAKLVTSCEDILEELQDMFSCLKNGTHPVTPKDEPPPSPQEAALLEALHENDRPIDELVEHTGLAPAQVGAALLSLELKQKVRSLPGQWYRRV
ncbi:MAG: DNA-processing protein DprA [Verrucomicrobiota bacterium]